MACIVSRNTEVFLIPPSRRFQGCLPRVGHYPEETKHALVSGFDKAAGSSWEKIGIGTTGDVLVC